MSMKKLFEIIEQSSEYVQTQALRNICYSSNSDIQFQTNRASDLMSEARHIAEQYNGSEIQTSKLDRLRDWHKDSLDQLAEIEAIHKAATAEFKRFTGSAWVPSSKKQAVSDKAKTASIGYWQKLIAKTENAGSLNATARLAVGDEHEASKKRKAS